MDSLRDNNFKRVFLFRLIDFSGFGVVIGPVFDCGNYTGLRPAIESDYELRRIKNVGTGLWIIQIPHPGHSFNPSTPSVFWIIVDSGMSKKYDGNAISGSDNAT